MTVHKQTFKLKRARFKTILEKVPQFCQSPPDQYQHVRSATLQYSITCNHLPGSIFPTKHVNLTRKNKGQIRQERRKMFCVTKAAVHSKHISPIRYSKQIKLQLFPSLNRTQKYLNRAVQECKRAHSSSCQHLRLSSPLCIGCMGGDPQIL